MAVTSFADKRTKAFFESGDCPVKWRSFKAVAARKLDMIDAATARLFEVTLDRARQCGLL